MNDEQEPPPTTGEPAGAIPPPPAPQQWPPPGAPRFDSPGPEGFPAAGAGPTSSPSGAPPTDSPDAILSERRPLPRVPAVLAAAGGLLVISSLAIFIGELPHEQRRLTGLLLSAAFLALGIFGMVLWRRRPAITVGVVVSALAVPALVIFAFVDPNRPNVAFSDLDKGKGTITEILVLSAVAWIVGYLVGPGRRAAFYLGAALVAVWFIVLVQVVAPVLDRTDQTSSFNPDTSSGGSGFTVEGPFSEVSSIASSAITRTAFVSLLVGLVYLAAAVALDRREGSRSATPFYASTAVILTVAVLALGRPWHVEGAAIMAMVLGGALVWSGAAGGRRFTAWFGGFAVFGGTLALMAKLSHHNNKVAGALALAAGIGLAVLANWLTGRVEPPADAGGSMTPLEPWLPPTAPTSAQTSSPPPAGWSVPPA